MRYTHTKKVFIFLCVEFKFSWLFCILFAKPVISRWRGAGHIPNKIRSPVDQSGSRQRSRAFMSGLEGGMHLRAVTSRGVGAVPSTPTVCQLCLRTRHRGGRLDQDSEKLMILWELQVLGS